MITLTRFGKGLALALNPDLVERIEATPDTVVTLATGQKLMVQEEVHVVVEMIRKWRASVISEAVLMTRLVVAAELDDTFDMGPGRPAPPSAGPCLVPIQGGSDTADFRNSTDSDANEHAEAEAALATIVSFPKKED